MTRWRRAGYSFVAVIVAVFSVSAILDLQGPKQDHWWTGVTSWMFALSMFAIPGWLVALPFVLLVRNIEGKRLWIWLVVGTTIGPLVFGIIDLISWNLDPNGGLDFGVSFILWSILVSFLTTGTYLYFLKLNGGRISPPRHEPEGL